MIEKKVIIKNPMGLHIRPAGVLTKVASECTSNIIMIFQDKYINCKSVLNIMSGAIKKGNEVLIRCEGNNEENDLNTIIQAIDSGLGEEI